MPPPASRVDLFVVPWPSDRDPAVLSDLVGRGSPYFRPDGAPGPEAFVEGGFRTWRLDVGPTPRFFANRQGGFRATCPACGAPLAAALARMADAWRRAEAPVCPGCGRALLPDDVVYAPLAVFARGALALTDVGSITLTAGARAHLDGTVGSHRVVVARVGR